MGSKYFIWLGKSQKLPVNEFKWNEDITKLDQSFIKSYNEEIIKEYFLEGHIQYLENLQKLHNDWLFLPERMKIVKVEKLTW